MRATLEQLKAMSGKQLHHHWFLGRFPFDTAVGCRNCLTQHGNPVFNGLTCHPNLAQQARIIWDSIDNYRSDLPKMIEEIYALRLFYDSIYPQPAPEPTEAVATQEVRTEVLTS